MHLNRLELMDFEYSFGGLSIKCLVPFSSCQLLIGVGHDYADENGYRLGLYDYHFWSIQTENILDE